MIPAKVGRSHRWDHVLGGRVIKGAPPIENIPRGLNGQSNHAIGLYCDQPLLGTASRPTASTGSLGVLPLRKKSFGILAYER
jgi:hypothetical protein